MVVVAHEEGWGWVITGDGIRQPYDPDLPGFVPMSEERANEVAAIIRARIAPPEAEQ